MSSKLPIKVAISFILMIVFLALGYFRFVGLGDIPRGLTQDEAYYLYDAYSINQTGNDLHGMHLPLTFRSTGEYKLNLTYLIAVAIRTFGLNTTSARLPSAVAGFLTLIILYFITSKLTSSRAISWLCVIILAFSPWHFGISRLFYESNVGLFFLALSILGGISILSNKHDSKLAWAGLIIGSALAGYFYNAFRYLGLLLIITVSLLDFYKNRYIFSKKYLIASSIYLVLVLPIIGQIFGRSTTMRFFQETSLHKFGYELTINEARNNCYLKSNKNIVVTKICYLFWNKPILYLGEVTSTALKLVSPEYLFFTSSDEYIVPKDYGSYLPYLLPIYLLGIYSFMAAILSFNLVSIFLGISLVGSVAVVSSLGSVVYHRNTLGLFIIMIMLVYGLNYLKELLKIHRQHSKLLIPVIIIFVIISVFQTSKYLIYYFSTYTVSKPLLFKYDAPDIYSYLYSKKSSTIYDNIFFGPIYAGIYWGLDPVDFQNNAKWAAPDQWGFSNADHWNNLHFKGVNLYDELCKKAKNPAKSADTLIVDDAEGKYLPYASYISTDFAGSLKLHAVYDIDKLYEVAKREYPGDICK